MPDPFADFDVVLINAHRPDPALDIVAMALDEYSATRDAALIIDKPGMQSARFRVQHIGWRFAGILRSLPKGHIQDCQTVQAGCHQVTLANGSVAVPALPPPNVDGVRMAPDSWLDDLVIKYKFGPYVIPELARVIREFAGLTEDQTRSFTYPVG